MVGDSMHSLRGPMDEFDAEILDIMQSDNHLSVERIAKRVHLSSSAVRRRLRRLNQRRIIESNIATVSPEAVGRKLMAIVEVTLEKETPKILQEFKESMLDAAEVMQCYYVTGDADFVLVVTARDIEDYENLTKKYFIGNPHIKRYHTNVVISRVKSGLRVPINFRDLPTKPYSSE
jgi:Lrp/AsnC family transcriptional regulator, leucine-responsive regulatory protein